jgi:hypothetical protein
LKTCQIEGEGCQARSTRKMNNRVNALMHHLLRQSV